MSLRGLARALLPGAFGRVGAAEPGPGSGAYDELAPWYDWPGAQEFAASCVEVAEELALGSAPTADACLDLACGTGTFLLAMAERELAGVGVDRSAAMLREARRKAREAGASLSLIRADLRALPLRRTFPLVTCWYDSLNHVADPVGLGQALAGAAGRVSPGGLLVFDTNNRAMYEDVWSGPDDVFEVPGAEVRVAYRFERRTGIGRARIELVPSDDRVTSERLRVGWVTQRCHPEAEIEDHLRAQGLELVARRPHPHVADGDGGPKDLWVFHRRLPAPSSPSPGPSAPPAA